MCHWRLSSLFITSTITTVSLLRPFIPCIEQPVTHCPPTSSARREFQTLLNRHHGARQGKVRRINKTGES
ncbi:hypothetical protein M405DRAFT_830008, partial [Rhizopogon salebrosus TDB-379]